MKTRTKVKNPHTDPASCFVCKAKFPNPKEFSGFIRRAPTGHFVGVCEKCKNKLPR